jgi:hypothetical protein
VDTAQIASIVDKVIEKNTTILLMKDQQLRQGNDIRELKDEQHRQGIILEDIQTQVQAIAEAVTPLLRNSEEMPGIKYTLESHKQEIVMTQSTLKNHIHDPSAHSDTRKS